MNPKNLIFVFVAFFLFSCNQNKKSGLTEINKSDYTISYDTTLRLDESKSNGTEFYLFAKKESPQDNFVENINLMIQNLGTLKLNFDQFVKISETQIKSMGKLLKSERVKTNKKEYQIFMGELVMNNMDLKYIQYDFIKNDKVYLLTYTAKKEAFEKFYPQMIKTMDSFELK